MYASSLFVGGCGNFNAGTPKMMHTALYDKLGALPNETRVWVGHEYTQKNLEYAATVEPDNEEIKRKLQWARNRTEVRRRFEGAG
jgi:hydroxyacylglutathione hydrolase